jgi:hypothetical protein
LRSKSPEFVAAWDEQAIQRFESRRREFIHPDGERVFEQVNVVPQDTPDLHVVAYLPVNS